jgi:hypothetical protein
MAEIKLGTTTFLKRTGLSGPVMRGLEAAAVIAPSKSDSGWRQFSESDVQAALKWRAERSAARRAVRR